MRLFLNKRLNALLLAMTLVLGMVPSALAIDPYDHTICNHATLSWESDGTSHWRTCPNSATRVDESVHELPAVADSTTAPTCYSNTVETKGCTVCLRSVQTELPNTKTSHIYNPNWSTSESQHWHACQNFDRCGGAQINLGNHVPSNWVQDNTQHYQTCTTCSLRLNTANHVDSNGDRICDICANPIPVTTYAVNFYTGSSVSSQTVTAGGYPVNIPVPSKSDGGFSYALKGWTTIATTTNVYIGQALVNPASTPINGLTNFYAVYTLQATGQNLSISLPNSSAISGNTAVTGGSLMSQMYGKFSTLTGGAMTRMVFGSPSGTGAGTLYSTSNKVPISSSVYYSYSNAAYGSYPLAGVYFQPSGNAGTFSIPYTAYDEIGNAITGTFSFVTTNTVSKISYSVNAGQSVAFNVNDFNNAYRAVYGGSMTYLTLSSASSLDSANGMVYYNYGSSNAVAFDRSSLSSFLYYYNNSATGHYPLSALSFYGGTSTSGRTISLSFRAYGANNNYVDGTVEIAVKALTNKINYSVTSGQAVAFSVNDFNTVYRSAYSDNMAYVTFSTASTLDNSNGTVYYNYGGSAAAAFNRTNISNYTFYYNNLSYGSYPLSALSFYGGTNTASRTVTLSFRAYGANKSNYVDGTVDIKISGTASKITYSVAPGQSVAFNIASFNKAYQDAYSTSTAIRYVTLSTAKNLDTSSTGSVYYNYGGLNETLFSRTTIDDYQYYYNSSSYGQYSLGELSFLAGSDFDTELSFSFRAYYSETSYVDGTLVIQPETAVGKGDIFYYATTGNNVQINANDIARFLNQKYPYDSLQSVKLGGVPSAGNLYYNYYRTSQYGSSQLRLTSSNYDDLTFHFSPGSKQYSLSDLTYVPSGTNYCTAIPFTAYSSSGRNVSGTILISVSRTAVAEVYGVTPRGTAIYLPDSNLYSAVSTATGVGLASIQILKLPASSAGILYCGNSVANTSTRYGYSSGTQRISQLRFIPTNSFTGSVELPYVAYNSNGVAIASGKFALGVVSTVRKFSDTPSSAWCFKYVTELSDAGIISGYSDGKFRYDETITYGAALKLIMLASGYTEQRPSSSSANVFSGYLARAKADGLVSGSVNLAKPITRQTLAQIAAKAMKLSVSSLSSVKPFTDTSDPYVQALNAAGVVEGYFTNGTSTFKPNNNLTRGHVSAIVWRMNQMKG